ncbi:MAG TPA: ABC transporter permease, partial [bacterium]|nr:ABC transporter permease [bacterium]
MSAVVGAAFPARSVRAGPRRGPWQRFVRNPRAIAGAAIMLFFLLVALGGQWLAPYPPSAPHVLDILHPPGGRYPLGTDDLGRDILSRVLVASRVSLE